MTSANNELGWYIISSGKGGSHGPKAVEQHEKWKPVDGSCPLYGGSTRIKIVYGEPVRGIFEPEEIITNAQKIVGLLRYTDPDEHDTIYVVATDIYNIGNLDYDNAIPTSAEDSRILARIFDYYLPRQERAGDLWGRRSIRTFYTAAERAGLSRPEEPLGYPDPAKVGQEQMERYRREMNTFADEVRPHIQNPHGPYSIMVEGMDEVLGRLAQEFSLG